MYYYPGMHGWALALMIIGSVIFWGLLIIAAIALIRYTKRGQVDSASHTANTAANSGPTIRSRRHRRGRVHKASPSPQQQFDEPPQRLEQEYANTCAVSRARIGHRTFVVCSHQVCDQ